jgi:hypothetical protein
LIGNQTGRLGLTKVDMDDQLALGGMHLFASVHAMLTGGMVPSKRAIVFGIISLIAGAIGGFEFWRAERYPGASKRAAQLAAGFKNGFMRGLRWAS